MSRLEAVLPDGLHTIAKGVDDAGLHHVINVMETCSLCSYPPDRRELADRGR